jgi:hypothetical protein
MIFVLFFAQSREPPFAAQRGPANEDRAPRRLPGSPFFSKKSFQDKRLRICVKGAKHAVMQLMPRMQGDCP